MWDPVGQGGLPEGDARSIPVVGHPHSRVPDMGSKLDGSTQPSGPALTGCRGIDPAKAHGPARERPQAAGISSHGGTELERAACPRLGRAAPVGMTGLQNRSRGRLRCAGGKRYTRPTAWPAFPPPSQLPRSGVPVSAGAHANLLPVAVPRARMGEKDVPGNMGNALRQYRRWHGDPAEVSGPVGADEGTTALGSGGKASMESIEALAGNRAGFNIGQDPSSQEAILSSRFRRDAPPRPCRETVPRRPEAKGTVPTWHRAQGEQDAAAANRTPDKQVQPAPAAFGGAATGTEHACRPAGGKRRRLDHRVRNGARHPYRKQQGKAGP